MSNVNRWSLANKLMTVLVFCVLVGLLFWAPSAYRWWPVTWICSCLFIAPWLVAWLRRLPPETGSWRWELVRAVVSVSGGVLLDLMLHSVAKNNRPSLYYFVFGLLILLASMAVMALHKIARRESEDDDGITAFSNRRVAA
jgi:hypothetical protein